MRRMLRLALALALVPMIGACGGDDDVDDNVPPASMPAPAADAVRVTDVDIGRSIDADRRVNDNDETDEFGPMDTIYVSVDTEGTASGSSLTARWTFEDGQVVDESSQTISPTGPAVTEFHISMPDGLPAGRYTVEILLNGQTVETEDFTVR
ncbi:hypothetical protein BH23GEM10_BH23GEM10_17840 [soil metagenome]